MPRRGFALRRLLFRGVEAEAHGMTVIPYRTADWSVGGVQKAGHLSTGDTGPVQPAVPILIRQLAKQHHSTYEFPLLASGAGQPFVRGYERNFTPYRQRKVEEIADRVLQFKR